MKYPNDRPSFLHSGLPKCITPLVIRDPALEQYPGLASGTGFFARRGQVIYLLTALHCLESQRYGTAFVEVANKLHIPFRLEGETSKDNDFITFDQATRLAEDSGQSSFLDCIALRVTASHGRDYKHLLSRAVKLPPSGLWLEQFAQTNVAQDAMGKDEPISFIVTGFPNSGTATEVFYPPDPAGQLSVHTQAVQTVGQLRMSDMANHFKLEHMHVPDGLEGFSGSPVFVQHRSMHGKQSALAGMLVCGSQSPGGKTAHFISVAALCRATGGQEVPLR